MNMYLMFHFQLTDQPSRLSCELKFEDVLKQRKVNTSWIFPNANLGPNIGSMIFIAPL